MITKSSLQSQLRNLAIGIILVASIILIWGYFYGITKIEWPKHRLPVYNEQAYKSASESYKDKTNFTYVGEATINDLIIQELDTSRISYNSFKNVIIQFDGLLENTWVIFKSYTDITVDNQISLKYNQIKTFYETELDLLDQGISNLSFNQQFKLNDYYSKKLDYLNKFIDNIN